MGRLSHIPGPRGIEFVRGLRKTRREALATFQSFGEQGDIVSIPWPMNCVVIYHPQAVKQVLLDHSKKYIKGDANKELNAILGEGLATTFDHSTWLRKRTIMAKELGPKAVCAFAEQFDQITKELIKRFESEGTKDICFEMKYIALVVACRTLLGSDLSERDVEKVNEAMLFTTKVAYERIFQLMPLPYWLPTPAHIIFKRHVHSLDQLVYRLIEEGQRRPPSDDPKSMLERLIHTVDPDTGKGFTKLELRDEILTMMIAGYETSAHALTWMMGLLARDQHIQDRLRTEIMANLHLNPSEYLEKLPYLKAIMLEAMRIYPSFPIISKKSVEEDQLLGHNIPPGTNIIIPLIFIQRSPKYWEKPLKFFPERFLDEESTKSNAFLPFSKGQRKCIGELFAMTEMAVIVFNLFHKFRLELVEDRLPKEIVYFSLKPDKPLMVKVSTL